MTKAVIYARYSSHNQTEESIEGQVRVCQEYAKRNNIHIVDTYVDRAISGTSDNRPQFQKMIKESEKGLFDTVLVYKFDRFARDRYDSANYKRQLKNNGVKLASAQENIPDSPEGIILESMLEGFAEYFSAELSQKVKRGKHERALKCQYHGSIVPIGYMIDNAKHYVVDPSTAPTVLFIFENYAMGETVASICRDLESKGIKTTKGTKFTLSYIRYMLHNTVYIGTYRCGEIVLEDAFEGIVSKELWTKCHQRLDKNRRAPARGKAKVKYYLSTKCWCGHCGMPIVAESTTSTNGTHHQYYKCKGRMKVKNGCTKKTIKKYELEDLVTHLTMEHLAKPEIMEDLTKSCLEQLSKNDKRGQELALLQKQLADISKQKNNIINALAQGIVASGVQEKLMELEEIETTLTDGILKLEARSPSLGENHFLFLFEKLKQKSGATLEEYKTQILEHCVSGVCLSDDRIVIAFNLLDDDENVYKIMVNLDEDGKTYNSCVSDFDVITKRDSAKTESTTISAIGTTILLTVWL